MGITALPEATIHLLGSAQALTTPTSLVKELIDNSLDAKATSIDILISQNTLDKIEVRDNGHGIQQEDLDALGRRGHTSKLRSFDELKAVGGVSLGFRGEALASAVQLGEVSVTTKTDGEAVATAIKLKAFGGIDYKSRASHPIGTTVCVLNFMVKLPVRKQNFLKTAPKTLLSIKELLQAYAFARPTVRFSLKVAKGNKGSWSFVPRPNDGIKEAVSQIIGRDAATQCIEKSLVFPETFSTVTTDLSTSSISRFPPTSGQFEIDAFLPRPDADITKTGHGQFISIDSRPVSHEKGTMKKIITMFKYYVRGAFGDAPELKKPFIRLSIKCPVASYDPNVEPAKNDVLFVNESLVLESVESLFKDAYGRKKTVPDVALPLLRPEGKKVNDFDLLLARKPPAKSTEAQNLPVEDESSLSAQPSPSPPSRTTGIETEEVAMAVGEEDAAQPPSQRKWKFDMSKDFTEGVDECRKSHPNKSRSSGSPTSDNSHIPEVTANSLNPWLIAKMTAPVRQSAVQPLSPPESSSSNVISILQLSQTQQDPHSQRHQPFSDPILLGMDEPDFQRFSTPPRRRHSDESIAPNVDPTFRNRLQSLQRRRYSNGDTSQLQARNTSLCANDHEFYEIRPSQPNGLQLAASQDGQVGALFVDGEGQPPRTRHRNDFISARNLAECSLISPPATQRPRNSGRLNGINKPFGPPRRIADGSAPSSGLRQITLLDRCQLRPIESNLPPSLQRDSNAELEWAMDFEQRKEDASRQRREEFRIARKAAARREVDSLVRTSPHENRYKAAIATLEADQLSLHNNVPAKEPFKTTLPDGDPRAYLMKQQRLTPIQSGLLKLTRAKSLKLPLERIPDEIKTHALLLRLSTDMGQLRQLTAGHGRA
ncbi:hypothetical protein G7Y89_g1049 [Cudoniella acicularis]|uniref:DNA mismatch repair protein S5 domain-containing protein n=1 Tax=Cudoniella acicularis TaxID=354080 RepID=A0A8H4WAN4_9HELO|nr:hypothetical protein G7Y89_g1049 [Cudoniella acicularis]